METDEAGANGTENTLSEAIETLRRNSRRFVNLRTEGEPTSRAVRVRDLIAALQELPDHDLPVGIAGNGGEDPFTMLRTAGPVMIDLPGRRCTSAEAPMLPLSMRQARFAKDGSAAGGMAETECIPPTNVVVIGMSPDPRALDAVAERTIAGARRADHETGGC